MMTKLRVAGWLVMMLTVPAVFSQGQEQSKRFSIWDIHLGEDASAIPDEYANYACGTNGGPPSLRIANFSEFKKCKSDADGLHEVYFEYDDQLEYEARALDDQHRIVMYSGTTVFEFPIVASVLFDDSGVVRGERMVTDPRQQLRRDRVEFWELASFLRQRFGDDGWACTNLPPEDGEMPVGSRFFKSNCAKTDAGVLMLLEQRFYQKKGQQFIDPVTGKPLPQAFESVTRFEMYDAAVPVQTAGQK
jgi:hypothetical protein